MIRVTTNQLPSVIGPQTPELSVSNVSAQSEAGLVWQLSVSGSDVRLAKLWATGATVAVGDVMVMTNGNVGRVVAQTGATGLKAPTTTGPSVPDGLVTWRIVPPFLNGVKVTNTSSATDGTGTIYTAIGEVASITTGDALLAGASEVDDINDPSLFHLIANPGPVVVTVKGLC